MSVTAYIRELLARGMSMDDALVAAEVFEAAPPQPSRLDVPAREWQRLRRETFERDGYKCVYCGADVLADPHCDHVLALARGGISVLENLATSCKRCNSSKGAREWSR